ncbi:MAG: MFS transporter [Chloroflexia bacterium]|nr:MFS transporter [Chloroflexia bacterium]
MSARRPTDDTSARQERPFRVLRYRDFRVMWGAEILSQTGTQIQRVAVAWQVFELTHDPFQLGLLGLVRFVPLFLFGLAGGVAADRYDRRRTLILTQLALMGVAAAFAALTATGRITMPWIYGLTALSSLFTAVSAPTRQALIPALVPTVAMPAAMSMGVLAFQSAGMMGPALGGALVASTGIAISYAVDAITFGLVAISALVLRARPARAAPIVSGRAAALEGLRFLRETPVLLGTMVLDFLANFFGASTTLMPIFASEVLGGGPRTLGLLLAAPAAGAVAGATVMASRRPLARPGVGILGAIVVYGLCIAAFALSRNMLLSLAFLAVSGAADSVSVSQRHTLRNLVTPDRLRGRVAAAHATFAGGGPQLGEFEAGIVAAGWGAPAAVVAGGVGAALAAIVIAHKVPGIARFRWESRDPAPNGSEAPE